MPDDLDRDLFNALMSLNYEDMGTDSDDGHHETELEPESPDILITESFLKGGVVAQASIDNELVGTAVLNLDTGEISPILVNSDHRRQGVATALIDVLQRAAKRAGLESVFASVAIDNEPSRNLWKNLGYCEWMKYETWLGDDDE